jgi:hypothetical protein
MTKHKECYGTMFHDTLHFSDNRKMRGKVFGFELLSAGLTRSNRSISFDLSEWDDCQKCLEFDHCYKLCMAKLALEAAISEE